eukprot:CAMPEP_0183431862 /NCGR_PEP_ID=MMETSP0370-20130417/55099_1 /TAXON_ID=268820 /ORGANISM="Peridinium aciculiferum, Strain PAER-2" /LENGTH=226 /DNA_ID=CAMNT_0025617669 /DNA_START=81 /DNA_END=761 /DNA_ORIENTATION=-
MAPIEQVTTDADAAAAPVARKSRASTPPPTKKDVEGEKQPSIPEPTKDAQEELPTKGKTEEKVEEKVEKAEAKTPGASSDSLIIKILAVFLFVLMFAGLPLAICIGTSGEPVFAAARTVFGNHVAGPMIGVGACAVGILSWKLMEKLPEIVIIKLLCLVLFVLTFGVLPLAICMGTSVEPVFSAARRSVLGAWVKGPAIGAGVCGAGLVVWKFGAKALARAKAKSS